MTQLRRDVPNSPFPIVLLHGLGSDEADLFSLGEELTPRHALIAYRGPLSYPPGYSWFGIEWGPQGIIADQDQAISSRDLLVRELESLGEPVMLGGFSQGAIVSLGLGWARPDLVRGLMLFSGRPLPRFFESPPGSGFAELPIFISHGTQDPVITIEEGRELQRIVRATGAAPDVQEYAMGHTISWPTLRDAKAWLSRLSA